MNSTGPEPAGLLDACRGGDPEAFAQLFSRHYDAVYALAASFTGDAALADDIAQQVFLKLLGRADRLPRDGDFTPWLYRVVANACVDNHRRVRRFVALEEVQGGPSFIAAPRQEEDLARRQLAVELRNALAALRPRLRLPLLLRYVSGLGYEEISRVLEIPVGTVASRLRRAQQRLRRALEHVQGCAKGDDPC
jgi:RNA polymerase sigma-70 factor (ECF subfamily)